MAAPSNPHRIRLDQLLVERGLVPSRARARDAVLRGTVRIDGVTAQKPGLLCAADAAIEFDDPAGHYVSRAALKLAEALKQFDVAVTGQVALDIGASTGGFTQVLLEAGVHEVFAIDVGHGQFHEKIAGDTRVTAIEGLNARNLKASDLGGATPALIVSDVSFISLTLALPPALDLAAANADLIALVKPQFEVGRGQIGKGGIVARDDALAAVQRLSDWLDQQPGWRARRWAPSPITGADGNQEFLLWGTKDR